MSSDVKEKLNTKRNNSIDVMFDDKPEENYNGLWKNLFFDKSGRSYLGVMTHESEEKARNVDEDALKVLYRSNAGIRFMRCLCGSRLFVAGINVYNLPEYSHSIQIPFKK